MMTETVNIEDVSAQPKRMAKELRVALLTNSLSPHSVALYECIGAQVKQFQAFLSAAIDLYHGFPSVQPTFVSHVQRSINLPPLWRRAYGAWQSMEFHIPYDTYGQLKLYKPDVILSVQMGIRTVLSVLYRQRRSDVKLILWATLSERTEQDRSWIREITRRWIVRRIDSAFVNGKSGERYLRKLGYKGTTFTVPYAIDDTPFLSYRYDPIPGFTRILYAGQLVPQKGLRAFCAALNRWCLDHPLHRVEFLLAGDGPEQKVLPSLLTADNVKICVLPKMPQSELAEHYRNSDLFAFPTLGDEWGVVVNEAMIAGLPVLGSIYSQAVTEMVKDGENGWLFDPLDMQSIYEVLTRALLTPTSRLKIMSRCSQETIAALSPQLVGMRAAAAIADLYGAAEVR